MNNYKAKKFIKRVYYKSPAFCNGWLIFIIIKRKNDGYEYYKLSDIKVFKIVELTSSIENFHSTTPFTILLLSFLAGGLLTFFLDS